MTDTRKQLETVAKAMGIKVRWVEAPTAYNYTGFMYGRGGKQVPWNPLTDNEDCAVMCAELDIDTRWGQCCVEIFQKWKLDHDCEEWKWAARVEFKNHDNDKLAAWRFAACSVAAQIGEMK